MAKSAIRIIPPSASYRATPRTRIRNVVQQAFEQAYGKGASTGTPLAGPERGGRLTKSQYAAQLAEMAGISKKQANDVLVEQARLAHQQAKNTFVIPGIGKLTLTERPARKMIGGLNPKTGHEITIPKKKVVQFRVAKAAKDAILGSASGRRAR